MDTYTIYHSIGVDRFNDTIYQPRIVAGTVQAESLSEAFRKSQNLEGDWNKENPCRSTSVGDMIVVNGEYYVVIGMGFKKTDYVDFLELSEEEKEDECKLNGYEITIGGE